MILVPVLHCARPTPISNVHACADRHQGTKGSKEREQGLRVERVDDVLLGAFDELREGPVGRRWEWAIESRRMG